MTDLTSRFLRRRRADPLTCRELVELVTDYLEDALPVAQRARFESHIAGCDGCDGYLEQMRRTVALLGELPAEALSPRAEAELRATFREWGTGHS